LLWFLSNHFHLAVQHLPEGVERKIDVDFVRVVVSQDRCGTTSFYQFDGQGSMRTLTNSSEVITDTAMDVSIFRAVFHGLVWVLGRELE
jgi:hypothetical protein